MSGGAAGSGGGGAGSGGGGAADGASGSVLYFLEPRAEKGSYNYGKHYFPEIGGNLN